MSTSPDSPVSSVLRHVTPGLARDYPASSWVSPKWLLSLSRNQADATGPVRPMEVAASKAGEVVRLEDAAGRDRRRREPQDALVGGPGELEIGVRKVV